MCVYSPGCHLVDLHNEISYHHLHHEYEQHKLANPILSQQRQDISSLQMTNATLSFGMFSLTWVIS